jgi:regulatory protein
MKEWKYSDALERMKKFCAQHEQCTYKVQLKLYQLQIPQAWHDKIISYLQEHDFLNDKRFAQFFIDSCIKKSWGKTKIKLSLLQLHIDSTIIDDLLKEFSPEDEKEHLMNLLKAKLKTLPPHLNPLKKKHKLYLFALRKGYDQDLVWKCLEELNFK